MTEVDKAYFGKRRDGYGCPGNSRRTALDGHQT